jgi:hypothetical protein
LTVIKVKDEEKEFIFGGYTQIGKKNAIFSFELKAGIFAK